MEQNDKTKDDREQWQYKYLKCNHRIFEFINNPPPIFQ